MDEIWKDIIIKQNGVLYDYSGLYQVSDLGNVRSLDRVVIQWNGSNYSERKYKGKILKQRLSRNGYLRVGLGKNGKIRWFVVHRLVANAFIHNTNNEKYINHKDENKLNNKKENLEWCSQSYNINYGNRNKKVSNKLKGKEKSEEHKNKLSLAAIKKYKEQPNIILIEHNKKRMKPVIQYSMSGEFIKEYESIHEAVRQTNIKSISYCCNHRQKQAGGYKWEFKTKE